MKWPLLWAFWTSLLSSSVPEYSVNGPLDSTTTNMASEYYHLDDYQDPEELPSGMHRIEISVKDQEGLMTKVGKEFISTDQLNSKLPEVGARGFLVRNITCLLLATAQFSCTWNPSKAPPDARYDVSISQQGYEPTRCFCHRKDGRVTGCHGEVEDQTSDITVTMTVSSEHFLYSHSWMHDPPDIAKLNPPHNISAWIASGSLHIQWEHPVHIPDKCFQYQLRMLKGHEPRNISGRREYVVPNIDLTRKHRVQMRVTKTKYCRHNNIWSDWSDVVEVAPSKEPYELNAAVIVAIALGIPMVLLAVLLLCHCQRLFEKLFPVPGPPQKIKQLLNDDNFIQVVPSRYVEETPDVLFVGSDECAKISL